MPTKCCVPLCKGNYETGPKVSVYRFPMDEELLRTWLRLIQRKDFLPNKNSRVCELHFKQSDFEQEACGYDEKTGEKISVSLPVKRLKANAVPSIFTNYPECCKSDARTCSRKSPETRKLEKEMNDVKIGLLESVKTLNDYKESRKVNSISDIKKCIETFGVTKFWTVYSNDSLDSLNLLCIKLDPNPFIQCSVNISETMHLTVAIERTQVKKLENFVFPMKIEQFNDIVGVLEYLENNLNKDESKNSEKNVINLIINLLKSITNSENENVIKFIQHQLSLLLFSKNNFRYDTDFLIFACILKTISSHAYNFLRESKHLVLPHPDTLRRICDSLQVSPQLELDDGNFLRYITSRVNFLQDNEKIVVLLIDEIHIKPFFDYKGGSIVGTAFDQNTAATSAFVFMVSSVLSPFKEVVHILPVTSINYQKLYSITKKVIVGLEAIGLKVICIITDNNSINNKAMSLFTEPPQRSFVYKHPVDTSRPLFFLIDSVHIFKNIRNNWLNQKNPGTCFFYPDFENPSSPTFKTASFATLRKIYQIESNEIVTYSKGLTLKSLAPSNLERQNVKLVLKIFNKFVPQALLNLGPKHNILHSEGTAEFIQIIIKWWDIFNVKTIFKGAHQRNVFMEPLNNDELDEKNLFLSNFLVWLDAWENMHCTTGALSKETHKALVQTTYGMQQLVQYCIDELSIKYILTGKIQTDCLEARFGKYRQMAGSQYHISMRQLLECEKKLRLQSCVKLELLINNNVVPLTHFDDDIVEKFVCTEKNYIFKALSNLNIDEKIEGAKHYMPVLTFLAGYCSHVVIKKLKCSYCKKDLVLDSDVNLDENYKLIKNLDNGGLKCPTQFVVSVIAFNYILVNVLYDKYQDFTKMNNQRQLVISLTLNILKNREITIDNDCTNGHESDFICKLLLHASTNIMLKNLCIKENDNLNKMKLEKRDNKKRKLETLKK